VHKTGDSGDRGDALSSEPIILGHKWLHNRRLEHKSGFGIAKVKGRILECFRDESPRDVRQCGRCSGKDPPSEI
jgi:hypothetical protein